MNPYFFLALAIVFEVTGTCLLKTAESFTRALPSVGVFACYLISLYLASVAIDRGVPVGIGYAIWSGVGLTLITIAATLIFQQSLDIGSLVGIALIVSGVVVMRLFSTTLRVME